MFSRQRYQHGSLQRKKRSKGPDVWELRYYDAERQRKTMTVGSIAKYPTKSAAEKAVAGMMLRVNADSPSHLVEVPKFGAVVDRYELEELPRRHTTRASYLSVLKNHIKPKWGDSPLDQIKPAAVETWLLGLALAPKTKQHIRGLMRTIFQCAERWELLEMGRNPIDRVRVKGGTRRVKRPGILTEAEFWKLVSHIPERYRTMVLVAQCLGLRVSELMGLQWTDFDFERGTVLVQRSVVHGRVEDVKTEYSSDHLPLDERLTKLFEEHRESSVGRDWVFANPRTGKPYHQEEIQKKHIRPAGEKAGISFRVGWHTFRHTYRSWLDQTGASMGVQKELMRHASIQTTMNVYGNAVSDSKRTANGKVVEMALKQPKPYLSIAEIQALIA